MWHMFTSEKKKKKVKSPKIVKGMTREQKPKYGKCHLFQICVLCFYSLQVNIERKAYHRVTNDYIQHVSRNEDNMAYDVFNFASLVTCP